MKVNLGINLQKTLNEKEHQVKQKKVKKNIGNAITDIFKKKNEEKVVNGKVVDIKNLFGIKIVQAFKTKKEEITSVPLEQR